MDTECTTNVLEVCNSSHTHLRSPHVAPDVLGVCACQQTELCSIPRHCPGFRDALQGCAHTQCASVCVFTMHVCAHVCVRMCVCAHQIACAGKVFSEFGCAEGVEDIGF